MIMINPLTYLTVNIDPALRDVSIETPVIEPNSMLGLIKKNTLKGIAVPASNIIEVAQPYSIPIITMGDTWQYTPMASNLATGKMKLKKWTLQSVVSEDDYNRSVEMGEASILAMMKADEKKRGIIALRSQLTKFAVDPWEGATTAVNYDVDIAGILASSSGATISNPSDLNATPGTPLASGYVFTGALQTTRVVELITAIVKKAFIKIDAKIGLTLPIFSPIIHAFCHPFVKAILDSTRDLLDATHGTRSTQMMTKDFADAGIIFVADQGVNSSYDGADDSTATIHFVADYGMDFEMIDILPPEGASWTPWKERDSKSGSIMTLFYETHKKLECGFRAYAYGAFATASASTLSFYKKVFNMTLKAYDTV